MRLVLLSFAVGLAPIAAASPAAKVQVPIHSQAELERYLHDTPMDRSPLGALSPGGRKRFLAGLEFGPRGLASLSFDDPAHELTHPQVVALFTLFDAQAYATDLGLDPDAYAIRQAERMAAAAQQGCRVQTCPESRVERAYDQLLQTNNGPRSGADRDASDRLFAPWRTTGALRSLGKTDLRLVERAAFRVASGQPNADHAAHAHAVITEMARRGMAEDDDYRQLYRILVSAR